MGKGFAKKKKEMKKMQEQWGQMQNQLEETTVTGEAGNGLVKLTLNGHLELLKLNIKPECVDPEDVEGLEDLIMAAHKQAFEKAKDSANATTGIPSGMIPGLDNLPF